MSVYLCTMTKELAREYFRSFVVDPDLFQDGQAYQPYEYSPENADARVERYQQLGRVYLALMQNEEPVGEIVLKNIDHKLKCCTLGISLRSDEYKNKGLGTKAEILTLQYAFGELDMETVYADSILKNERSQHVLQKVGFKRTHWDDTFVYFRCDRTDWTAPIVNSVD